MELFYELLRMKKTQVRQLVVGLFRLLSEMFIGAIKENLSD